MFVLHGDADGQRLVHGTHSKQVKQLEFGVTSFGCAKSALKVRNAHNNSAVGGDSANSALDAGVFYMLVPDSCGTGTSSRQVSAAVQTVLDYSQIAATGGVATHNLDTRCNWKFYFCGVSQIALFKGTTRSLAGANGVVSGTDLATALSYDSTNTRWEFTSSNTDYEVDTLGMNIAADATGACPGGAAGVSTTVTLFNSLAFVGTADFSAFQYDMVPVNCLLAEGVAAPVARTSSNVVSGGVSDFLNTHTLDWRCDWLVRFCGSAVKVSDTAVVNDAPQDNVVHAAAVAHGTVFPLAKNLQDRVLDYPTSTQTPKKVTWFELSENLGCADASVQVAAAADEPPIGGVTHSFVPSNCQNVNRSGTALSSGTIAPPMQTRLDGFPAAGGAVEHKLDVRCDWTVKFCTAGVKVGAAASTEAAAFGTVAVSTAFKLDGSISSSVRKLVYASATQTADQTKAVDRLWLTGSMATACTGPPTKSAAPSSVGLKSGSSPITSVNPEFTVAGVVSGASVTVKAVKSDSTEVAKTVTASGTSVDVPFTGSGCGGSCDLSVGSWTVTATQDEDGTATAKTPSDPTAGFPLVINAAAVTPTKSSAPSSVGLKSGSSPITSVNPEFTVAGVVSGASVTVKAVKSDSTEVAKTVTASGTSVDVPFTGSGCGGSCDLSVGSWTVTATQDEDGTATAKTPSDPTAGFPLVINAAAVTPTKSSAPSSVGLKSGSSPITSVNPEFTVAGVVSGASVTVKAVKSDSTEVAKTVTASGTSVDVPFTGSGCGGSCDLSVGSWTVTATQDEDGTATAKTPSDPTAGFPLVINAAAVTPTKSSAPSSVGLKSGSSPITSVNPEFTVAGVVSGASVTVKAVKSDSTEVAKTVTASGTSVDVPFTGSGCGGSCDLSVGSWTVTATQDEDGTATAKTPSDPTAGFPLVINAAAVTPTKSSAPSSVGLKSGSSPITSVNPEFTVAGVVSGASVTVKAVKSDSTEVAKTVTASGTSVDVPFTGSGCGGSCDLSVGSWTVTATQDEDGTATAKTPSDPTAGFPLVINAAAVTPTKSSAPSSVGLKSGSSPITSVNPEFTVAGVVSGASVTVKAVKSDSTEVAKTVTASGTSVDVPFTGSGCGGSCDLSVGSWTVTATQDEDGTATAKTPSDPTAGFPLVINAAAVTPTKSAAPSSVGLKSGSSPITSVNPEFTVAGVVSGASVTVKAVKSDSTEVAKTVTASGTSVDVPFTGSGCGGSCDLSVGSWTVTATQDEDGTATAKTPSDPTAGFPLVINAAAVTPTKSAAPSSVGLKSGSSPITSVNPEFTVAGVVSGASVTVKAVKSDSTEVAKTVTASGTSVDVPFTGSGCGGSCDLSVGSWTVTATQDEDGTATAKTPSDPTAGFPLVINAPAPATSSVMLEVAPLTTVNPMSATALGVKYTFTPENCDRGVAQPAVQTNADITSTGSGGKEFLTLEARCDWQVGFCEAALSVWHRESDGSRDWHDTLGSAEVNNGDLKLSKSSSTENGVTVYFLVFEDSQSHADEAVNLFTFFEQKRCTKSAAPSSVGLKSGSSPITSVNPEFTVAGVVSGASVTVAAVKGNTTVSKTVTASGTSVDVPFTGSTCGAGGSSACALSVGNWTVTATQDEDGAATAKTPSDPTAAFSLVINAPAKSAAPSSVGLMGGGTSTTDVNPTFRVAGVASGASVTVSAVKGNTTVSKKVTASATSVDVAFTGSGCGGSCDLSVGNWTVTATQDEDGTATAKTDSDPTAAFTLVINAPPSVTSITARPASLLTNAVSIVTFVFSGSVTGFAAGDVDIVAGNTANNSAGSVSSVSGSGTTYTARFTATAADTYTLSIPANAVVDGDNTGNTASTSQVNETIVVTAPIPDTTFTGRVSVTSTDTLDTDISNRNHAGTRLSVQVSPVGNRAGCSPSRSVSLTLAANGSASAQVANLVDSPAGGAACSYTVSFPNSVLSTTNNRVQLVGQGSSTATIRASATTATRAYQATEIVVAPVVFAVSVASASPVTEGEPLLFQISVPGPASQSVEVNYTVSGLGEEDSTGSETIDAGSSVAEISVATNDDKLDNADRTVRVTLTSATGGASIDPQGSTATGIVKDNDDAPTAGLTEVSIKIDRLVLAVTLSDRSARDVKVNFTTTVGNGSLLIPAGDLTADTFVVFGADELPSGGSLLVRLVSAQNATIDVNARERLVRDPQQTWQFHITSRRATPRQLAQGLELADGWKLFSWRDASQRWVPHTAASGGSTALAAGTTVVFRGSDPSEAMLEAAGLGRPSSLTFSPGWNIFTPAPGAIGLTSDDFTTTSAGGSAVLFSSELVDCTTNAGVLVIYTYDQSDPQALIGWRISLPCHPELQARFDIPAIASIDENDTIYAYFYSGASVELTFANGQYSPA